MINPSENNERLELHSPTALPRASAFLWNRKMMIHMNCRGYAVAQFLQPEPAKYSHAPNLEAKTFMQPEQPYYAHHPGRFFYIKDEESSEMFSVPYEPVRTEFDRFVFSAGKSDIRWEIEKLNLLIEIKLSLSEHDVVEIWSLKITNKSSQERKLSIYPYFTVGYMSWMNQSGEYDEKLNAIVCSSITPYQKYHDYYTIKNFKDKTFLLAEKPPVSWEVNQENFEGEGGLNNPSAIQEKELKKGNALYETPACIMQYRLKLTPSGSEEYNFIFGPAKDNQEIEIIRQQYFPKEDDTRLNGLSGIEKEYAEYISKGKGCIQIKTPDKELNNFVNHWLPRQIYYHGETNRLCTDPQTRNYLQDNMGMSYIIPETARAAFLFALSQQAASGAMPDGILLREDAELKYINQVPHTDHCAWLPICLKAYLDETSDRDILFAEIPFSDNPEKATVYDHINRAMQWLLKSRDERGLNYIAQGDWCDPMNMVGYKGKGVSGWLTLATSYALKTWGEICNEYEIPETKNDFRGQISELNKAINKYLWDGNWYARGITDDDVVFGISRDKEGSIFLNPQSWALLSGCSDANQMQKLIGSVEEHLESPYGIEMLGPPFTKMREDVGRVTQKFPGSAENGSIYNHAAAFYVYGLYSVAENDRAYRALRKMIPGPNLDDILQRGQLPVFVPNYYRGAFKQFPRTAGRSSQLFNTGTAHWIYRSILDGLFGLSGCRAGLKIDPQIPSFWAEAKVIRQFRGAEFHVEIIRDKSISETEILVNGERIQDKIIKNIIAGKTYKVQIKIAG